MSCKIAAKHKRHLTIFSAKQARSATPMPNAVNYRPDSEDLENLTKGWVMANRINDVVARPDTKRYRGYLRLVQGQFIDPHVTDPDDAWRHKELLPRAIDAYERRHGVDLARGRLYSMPDYRVAAAPDAVESEFIGLTIHIRQTLETFEDAVRLGVTPEMSRHGRAMLWVTGFDCWAHLDYFEDAATRARKLFEHVVTRDPKHQNQLGDAMINFYARTRLRASEGTT